MNNLIEIPFFLQENDTITNNARLGSRDTCVSCQVSLCGSGEWSCSGGTDQSCSSQSPCGITCESCQGQGSGGCSQGCSESSCGSCEICNACQVCNTCQEYCELNDCQSFCESGYQNIGIYTNNNNNQQVAKINNIQVGKDDKKNSILQVYAGIKNKIKLVYDAIDNIVGIAIVADGIFNTDASGVKGATTIKKYEWCGELNWDASNAKLELNNNVATTGSGLSGKLYFKLKDGTYIDNEEIIKILFTYHKFILEVYNNVSSSSSGSNTIFGKVFADNETFIFTKDTMLNLNFSLSTWYSASYYSGFSIKKATIDGRELSVEFFDKTPELPYYANIENVEKAIININRAVLFSGATNTQTYFDGTMIATDKTAYQTWINNYGTVELSTSGSSYSSCRIEQNKNTSSNGFALYLSGLVFLQYKDGVKKRFDDSNSLCKYFKGTSKINFAGSGSSWYYWSGYLNDFSNFRTTKTFNYPDDVMPNNDNEGNWCMGVGRVSSTTTTYMRCYFYNLELNNIGFSSITIPTEFQIDSTLL